MKTSHHDCVADTLEKLLSYDDEDFIRSSYLTLLGREPDPDGQAYYLARLRAGISKIEILACLHLSEEGRIWGAELIGLKDIILRHRLLKIPVLGSVLRLAGIKPVGRSIQQKMQSNKTRLSPNAVDTLEELMSYNDEDFIRFSYLTLLGREPDPEGCAYYLARVRAGISKIEILACLHLSKEGRACGAELTGLKSVIRSYRMLKTPVLGLVLQFVGTKQTRVNIQQQLRSIDNKLYLADVRMQQCFTEVNELLRKLAQGSENQKLVLAGHSEESTTNRRSTILAQVRQTILSRENDDHINNTHSFKKNNQQTCADNCMEHVHLPPVSDAVTHNRSISHPRILWVINGSDMQTQKYRVFNYSAEFVLHGVQSEIVMDANLLDIQPTNFDIVILNRIAASENSRRLISVCKKVGIPIVFDIDDLVFDPDRIELLRFVKNLDSAQQEQLKNGFGLWRETLLSCDAVTTSTFALSKEVRKLNIPSFVLPNTISRADCDEFSKVSCQSSKTNRTGTRIGYFSGTKTHQEDFKVCALALSKILGEFPTAELLVVGHLDIPGELQKCASQIVVHPLMSHAEMLRCLSSVDINLVPLEMNNAFTDCKSELKIFEAAIFGIPSVASPTSTFSAVVSHGDNGLLAESSEEWYVLLKHLIVDINDRMRMGQRAKEYLMRRFSIPTAIQEAKVLYNSLINNRTPHMNALEVSEADWQSTVPLVTIIAILYGKQNEVRYFLESLRRQDFQGLFEVLLVDDMSTDNSVRIVEDFVFQMNKAKQFAAQMKVRIIKNTSNLGNCASRNRAIAEANGNVIIVIDADCMVNRSYVFEHYRAHQHGDCDVAIGPMNIETFDADPYSVLGRHESDRTLRISLAELQDPKNPDSFVNCITRNFSISKQFLTIGLSDNLFDERFGYSADPNSGFGWEDVEMGCRLYKAGARIRFLPETFSIHVSHPSTTDEGIKAFRSLKNYRRLHETHPDLVLLSRQWGIKTYQAIINWTGASADKLSNNDDYSYLEGTFDRYRRSPITAQSHRPLRILTYRWHCSHQYELYRSGHDFTLATGTGTGLCESWEWDKRPMPQNANFTRFDEINPKDYDLAILHFDENVLHPERCNGKVPLDWGATLRSFLDNVNLPKVAICHGTPQFVGQYNSAYTNPDLGAVYEDSRKELVELFHDILVVCNSHQACHEWGFKKSTVVWHGFSPHDYPMGTGDRGVLTMLYAALENRPHYNGLFVFNHVRECIKGAMEINVLKVPEPPLSYKQGSREWSESKFLNYSREIGSYSTYLNTTLRSPMPRSRGEAMMAGLVSVSMRNHDVDLFIRNGANGFFADCHDELSDQLLFLEKHPAARKKMAAASRQTALDIFNQDRYLAEWSKIFKQTVG
ncbi:Glycosyltransferase, GT2 family [Trichlorobacter thiogenes]|uniref:Glycosyltransferase, GT2 family n=1 Tax=Trichlorobacter thiogenes TaxID=115783 RepID=A0A1T4PE32_9BACT|nr:glycosyltransferase [Trichlorobacter thiogenes]SJZ89794.1 Glycosyltransferase, GT2 family [Trichlorobacter thiogenes]